MSFPIERGYYYYYSVAGELLPSFASAAPWLTIIAAAAITLTAVLLSTRTLNFRFLRG